MTLGFTATVNIEMNVAGVEENVTVTGASPVVDAQATKVTPILRHQAGQSFGRTFNASTNYGNVRIAAEPITARRQDNITIFDLRFEKVFKVWSGSRFAPFLDVFNMFNANPEQNITWSSGTSFLQPLNIAAPRLARMGAKFEW